MERVFSGEEASRVRAILKDFLTDRLSVRGDLPRDVRAVLERIKLDAFDSELNVRTLKVSCQIRDNNVSSRFRYLLGRSIKEYIEDLRLEAAEILLQEDGLSIFEVAASVGYYHPQTFYRAFYRRHRCTPAEYRRANGIES